MIDFVLVLRREGHFFNQLHAFLFKNEEWRRISTEHKMIGAYGFKRAAGTGYRVTGRFQIHHFEVMAGLMLYQHGLITAEEETLVLQSIGVVQPSDHLANSTTEVGGDDLGIG